MKRVVLVVLALYGSQLLVGAVYSSESNLVELRLIQEIIQQVRDGRLTKDHLRSLIKHRNPFDQKTKPAHRQGGFSVNINYDLSVESLVINGKYDWKDDNITNENFPTARKGEVDLVLELVHFNEVLTSEEVLEVLDEMGYRPAELYELLAVGAQYPEEQKKNPIVALSSDGQRLASECHPYLWIGVRGRELRCHWFGSKWGEDFRFLAVSK